MVFITVYCVSHIAGTTANDMHFQAYLLEGIVRLNEDRASAALEGTRRPEIRSYHSALRHLVNQLNMMVYGSEFDDCYRDPYKYTGGYEDYLPYATMARNFPKSSKYRKDAVSCVGQCNSLISVGKYNSIKVTYVNVHVSLTR